MLVSYLAESTSPDGNDGVKIMWADFRAADPQIFRLGLLQLGTLLVFLYVRQKTSGGCPTLV